MGARSEAKAVGARGEELAAAYFASRDWTVLERNWRCAAGEADLVVEDDDGAVVLVEVKTRRTQPGSGIFPEAAVDRRKRERYRSIARCYLACHPDVDDVRFDVVALTVSGGETRLTHFFGAFDGCEVL